MPSLSHLPEAIQWHEGMLLAPQHFQQMSFRLEALSHFHNMHVNPYYWGLVELELDEPAVGEGVLRVLNLTAIMPDGLVVRFRREVKRTLELDFNDKLEALTRKAQPVFLAIPRFNPEEPPRQDGGGRFESVEGAPVVDMNTGDRGIRIPRLRPVLSLTLGRPPLDFAALPIAVVACQGRMPVLQEFQAPSLRVTEKSPIARLCNEVAASARGKAFHLAQQATSQTGQNAPVMLQTQQAIHCLTAGLPMLESMIASQHTHPYHVFLAMANLMGHLAVLGKSKVPPQLHPYDHDDCLASFREVYTQLREILSDRVIEAYRAIPFKRDNRHFYLHVEREWLNAPIYLAVEREETASQPEVRAWMEAALIGPRSQITSLQDRRVLGLPRTFFPGDSGLIAGERLVLYRVETDNPCIVPGEDLVVIPANSLNNGYMPATLLLYVKN